MNPLAILQEMTSRSPEPTRANGARRRGSPPLSRSLRATLIPEVLLERGAHGLVLRRQPVRIFRQVVVPRLASPRVLNVEPPLPQHCPVGRRYLVGVLLQEDTGPPVAGKRWRRVQQRLEAPAVHEAGRLLLWWARFRVVRKVFVRGALLDARTAHKEGREGSP